MDVCERCKGEISATDPDPESPFPAFSVAGGLLGILGGILTGQVLLVAAGLLGGVGVDAMTRKCGICGADIEDDESGYRMLAAVDEGTGERSYRPVNDQPHAAPSPQRQRGGRSGSDFERGRKIREREQESLFKPEISPEDPTGEELVFDRVRGKLVPRQESVFGTPAFPQASGADLTWDLGIDQEELMPSPYGDSEGNDPGGSEDIDITYEFGFGTDDEPTMEDPLP